MIGRGRTLLLRALILSSMAPCLVSCGRAPAPVPSAPAAAAGAGSSWTGFRDGFIEAYFEAHPCFAVAAGRHEHDGKLQDWSAAGIAAEIARLHAAREAAVAFADGALSEGERFERDYLISRIDRDLFWLEVAEAPFHNPAFYLDWISDDLDPAPYLTREYAPLV